MSDTQEREFLFLFFLFYSDPVPRALLYFPCFPSFPSCGFLMGTLHQRSNTKVSPFILQLNML